MSGGRAQIFRFILIGGSSTALYFLLLIGLRDSIASTIWLTTLCYGAAMAYNFLAQGLFTFRTGRLSRRHAARYLVVQGIAMAVNALAMATLVDGVGLPLVPAQVIVTACVTVAVFLASRNWVYR